MRKDLNPDYLPAGHPWRELGGAFLAASSHGPSFPVLGGQHAPLGPPFSFSETRAVGSSSQAAEGVQVVT